MEVEDGSFTLHYIYTPLVFGLGTNGDVGLGSDRSTLHADVSLVLIKTFSSE